MSDADTEGTELGQEPEHEEATGGLRRAMEQRGKSLQDAEERIRREQAALQEQAKVVFAEREAREAALEQLAAELEAREKEVKAAGAGSGSPSKAEQRRVAELEQTINALEQQLAEAT